MYILYHHNLYIVLLLVLFMENENNNNDTTINPKKRFNNCEITFKQRLNFKEDNIVYLEIGINDAMRDIIKEVCVLGEKTPIHNDYLYFNGDALEFIRYKVLSSIFSSLNSNRELLFNCELIENKKIVYPFHNIDNLEFMRNRLIDISQKLCQIVKNLNVTYKVIISENMGNN